MTVSSKLVVMR